MLQERLTAIREELCEVENLPELKAIWCNWQAEAEEVANSMECQLMLRSTICRLRLFTDVKEEVKEVVEQAKQEVRRTAGARCSAKYVLLSTDVGWSTKPQVHALMQILGAHVKPGEVVGENDIVNMMVANEAVLATRQGGKRIWDYYKGDHMEGLAAHNNVKKL